MAYLVCQSGIVVLDGGHLFGHVQLLLGRQLQPVAVLDAQHGVVVLRIVVIVDVLVPVSAFKKKFEFLACTL